MGEINKRSTNEKTLFSWSLKMRTFVMSGISRHQVWRSGMIFVFLFIWGAAAAVGGCAVAINKQLLTWRQKEDEFRVLKYFHLKTINYFKW